MFGALNHRLPSWRLAYFGALAAMGIAAALSGYTKGSTFLIVTSCAAAAVVFLGVHTGVRIVKDRPDRPALYLTRPSTVISGDTLDRLTLFTGSVLFFLWLAPIKALIPAAGGFFADPYLASADRMLLGRDAWELAHGVPATAALDVIYPAWPLTITVCVMLLCLYADKETLRRFCLSWAACFALLGIGLAFLLASAGPIYGPELGFGFEGLRPAIAGADVTLLIRDELWRIHATGATQVGGGISAAPSMHCALTFLLVLAVRHTRFFVPALIYAAVIWFGSIYLGWHYAVDGLISLAGVWIIWHVTGRLDGGSQP